MKTAMITGASRGLGRAMAMALVGDGWRLIVDARQSVGLDQMLEHVPPGADVVALVGDVADPAHRAALVAAADRFGRLDALINNASTLGPTPLPRLLAADLARLTDVFQVNTFAPVQLAKALSHVLSASRGAVLNISSDAGVEHYENWGLYGASKAALDHLTLTLAAESPEIDWYAVDPGDMRTQMQQEAFPDADIADLPQPDGAAQVMTQMLEKRPTSGRYRAADLMTTAGTSR